MTAQIKPKVLISANAVRYNGKTQCVESSSALASSDTPPALTCPSCAPFSAACSDPRSRPN
jgi:hypothetical protein